MPHGAQGSFIFCMFFNFDRLGSEGLAQEVLSALRERRLKDAEASALAFSAHFGSVHPEAHALCAHVLREQGKFKSALRYWEKAIEKCPMRREWLENAIRLTWILDDEESRTAQKRYLAILAHLFLTPPSLAFLHELSLRGDSLLGSLGIHAGKVYAWIYLPENASFSLKTSNDAPKLSPGQIKKRRSHDHTLCEITLPLATAHNAYFIEITVNGRHLTGSPGICSPIDAARPKTKRLLGAPSDVTVVIPCYDGYQETVRTLAALFASLKHNTASTTILCIWDHGPNQHLLQALQKIRDKKKLFLVETPRNLGFLGAVNYALSLIPKGHVLLLNSDTLVHGDWIDRMLEVASRSDCATVTPFGSDAELLSYPSPYDRGSVSSFRATAKLDSAAKMLPAALRCAEIPVGVGFCMLITRKALHLVSGLDGFTLFRGYGEETDFCLRAKEKGLKNYAACNVYVAHLGGRSFGATKRAYAAQNNRALFARYPDYDDDYTRFLLEDPLRKQRDLLARNVEQCERVSLHLYPWSAQYTAPVTDKKKILAANALECFVLPCGSQSKVLLRRAGKPELSDQLYRLPEESKDLTAVLTGWKVCEIVHHTRSPRMLRFFEALAQPLVCDVPEDATQETAAGDTNFSSFLVLAPNSFSRWKRFLMLAWQNRAVSYFVPHLKDILFLAPCPENVRELPDVPETGAFELSAILLCESCDQARLSGWRAWLADRELLHLPWVSMDRVLA